MPSKKSFVIAAATLIIVQLLCFGPIITHVGFYLDDWATLCFLHFAPKEGDYLGLLHYYLVNDSRVLIRPLEVLHFGTIYFLAQDKPLLYHVVNLIFETICSVLFYLLLLRLTARQSIALAGALFLALYPSHDSTHYWVICSSVALSLALYLASALASVRACDLWGAVDAKKPKEALIYAALSFVFFVLSLLNYETFLPLAAVTVVICLVLTWRGQGAKKDKRLLLVQSVLAAAPPALATVLLLVFLKVIVPMMGHGYAHAIKLDPTVMLATIGRGLALNAPFEAIQFFLSQAHAALTALTSSEIIRLVALLAVAAGALVFLARGDWSQGDEASMDASVEDGGARRNIALLAPVDLIVIGLFTIFVSYTIFGLSPDYMPTYITLVNRVNTGASLGVGLVLAGLCCLWESFLRSGKNQNQNQSQGRDNKLLYVVSLTAAASCALLLFTLADWGLSKPWIVSWTTQKEVRQSLTKLPANLDKDASILLISCPRYVMWSPVFDGVWDYQNMVRITLDRPEFKANVVSERLSMTPSGIKDVSYGYECGSYPFDKLFLMVAPHPELIPVRNPAAFVELVEQRGMTFGLDKKTLSKWREQSAQTPKLDASH